MYSKCTRERVCDSRLMQREVIQAAFLPAYLLPARHSTPPGKQKLKEKRMPLFHAKYPFKTILADAAKSDGY
jgi:hypothetical protein